MKVVHIFWSLTYGGIETMLVNIANEQTLLGAEVHVIIINDIYDKELVGCFDKGVTLHFLHRKQFSKGLLFAIRMNRLLCSIKPNAIHLHDSRIFMLLWKRSHRCLASATLHSLPGGELRRRGFIYKILPILDLNNTGNVTYLDKINRVFSISNAVKDELWNKYRINSNVIANGILTRCFKARNSDIVGQPFRIVQVSRLECEYKGQDLLIEAVASLSGKIIVDFIGDGSSREYLERLVKDLHVEKYVRFLGAKPQSYIAEHLREYDLFVQPSRNEGFGLTVAEAMASKVPVLVSEGQGPAEVTCGDRYGWLFENCNVENLVSQIEHIITHYSDALLKADKACDYVRKTYDVSVTAQKYLDMYCD